MTWVTLTAQIIGMGIIVFGVLTALLTRYRQWRTPAPPSDDEMPSLHPTAPHAAWHSHPCGCWCGADGRTRVCPTHALEVQEIRDLLAWEKERHEP